MSFGVSPANKEFQRRINQSISGLYGVLAVHDDVLIYGVGETSEEAQIDHDKKLISFLDCCSDKKNQTEHIKVKYLGHILTFGGIKIDPTKVLGQCRYKLINMVFSGS